PEAGVAETGDAGRPLPAERVQRFPGLDDPRVAWIEPERREGNATRARREERAQERRGGGGAFQAERNTPAEAAQPRPQPVPLDGDALAVEDPHHAAGRAF